MFKVEIISLTEEGQERRDYGNALEIRFNGSRVFSVYDGEPEDSNLCRDFNDCWKIPDLIEKAYKAGLAGEELEITSSEVDEI